MTMQCINPFFQPVPTAIGHATPKRDGVRYAKLPQAPVNASPVPHLTSLYHNDAAGNYGSRSYPGNCGGNLIKDLLQYFRPDGLVFDPMSGSGTCADVCAELGLACMSWDIHRGLDACGKDFTANDMFAFIWAHPPYWRQKLYAADERDLSRAPTLDDFLRRYGQFFRNCAQALKSGGKLAVLMGDYNLHSAIGSKAFSANYVATTDISRNAVGR
jgi:hypothetical protein